VNHLIDIVGSNTRLQCAGSNIQDLTSQATDDAHALLLLLVQDLDTALAEEALLGDRDTILGVIGIGNGGWDGALR
jgi:citrate synthase